MKIQQLFLITTLIGTTLSSAHGYTVSGGIREFFTSSTENSYAGDGAAKVKITIFEAGADSMTLHIRLGMMSPTDSSLFHPVNRSSRAALDIMTSRIRHANGGTQFKPMIFQNPELGSPAAFANVHSSDPAALLASYNQMLQLYLAIASGRSINEFILGAGLGETFQAAHAERWKSILSVFKTRLTPSSILSLEISSLAGLKNLEQFKASDPKLFSETWEDLGEVRFTLPVADYVSASTLDLNSNALHDLMIDRIKRVQTLFPDRKIGLGNVMLPGCHRFTAQESELECPTHSAKGFTDSGAKAQAEALRRFFDTLDLVQRETKNSIQEVELLFATTQSEPLLHDADPRSFIYNPTARDWLKKRLTIEHHHSAEYSSPAKAFLPLRSEDLAKKKACIYFDEFNDKDVIGPIHARMLENLVGAFPEWTRERRSVKLYRSGDLNDCQTVFYLASHFSLTPPASFYPEVADFSQKHVVTWFNYKFDTFSKVYAKKYPALGFTVPMIIQPDQPPNEKVPDPGFFRFFDYKGETFEKLAKFDPTTHALMSSPELSKIVVNSPSVKTLALARHSKSSATLPYAVEQPINKGGFFYFADLPFSFVHHEDRYFIFCDVIYDILKEKAPERPPIALVRIEDVNASVKTEELVWLTDYLADQSIPFSIALIPYYSNLFNDPETDTSTPVALPATKYPNFIGALKYAQARDTSFVFHGVAHEAGDLISGYSGSSGSDYEFWSWPKNEPLPHDQPEWLVKQIEIGESVLMQLGIRPVAWEVPHYAASAMNYVVFGKLFEWNYHAGLYFKSEIIQDVSMSDSDRYFECLTDQCRLQRAQKSVPLKVMADYSTFGSQMFPYPIYRDSYGQALIPESIGMVDFAMYPKDTWRPISHPADLLRRAKKLKVIRGAMASFFWHPALLDDSNAYYKEAPGSYDTVGGKKTLTTLIEGLKELGYQFRSISDCDLFPSKTCKKGTI